MNATLKILLGLFGTLLFSAAFGQDIHDDEADVLITIEREWEASLKGDYDRIDDMLTADFMGWSKNSPAPRTKKSTSKWNRFNDKNSRLARYELYPLSITINGDVAVAHYLYSTARKNKDGTTKNANGRYTDVLVRTEDGWKFVAWHGGNDD